MYPHTLNPIHTDGNSVHVSGLALLISIFISYLCPVLYLAGFQITLLGLVQWGKT